MLFIKIVENQSDPLLCMSGKTGRTRRCLIDTQQADQPLAAYQICELRSVFASWWQENLPLSCVTTGQERKVLRDKVLIRRCQLDVACTSTLTALTIRGRAFYYELHLISS